MLPTTIKSSAVFLASDVQSIEYIETIQDADLGRIVIGASEIGIRYIKINSQKLTISDNPNLHTNLAKAELIAYLKGDSAHFTVAVDISGYTDFSQRVWRALMDIPYGKTISYLELSQRLGDVKAIRAVGTANGRNPIPIVIPCHRVIGSDGSLTGYALGLETKRRLLAIENPNKYGIKQMELFE
jgi:methylated-DNA-[protein]-cysteine S-methyltransferase